MIFSINSKLFFSTLKIALKFTIIAFVNVSCFGQTPGWTDLKLYFGASVDEGVSIKVDNKDNYYITAFSYNPLSSFIFNEPLPPINCNFIQPVRNTILNGVLFRYDSARNLNLSIIIENSTPGEIAIDSSGNIYVTGSLQNGSSRNSFLKKYAPKGDLLWTKLIESLYAGNKADDVITSIDIDKEGSIVICGSSYGDQVSILGQVTIAGPANFITKINSVGDLIWNRNFSSDLGVGINKVRFDKAGNILGVGNLKAKNANNTNAVFAKFAGATGDIIWQKQCLSVGNFAAYENAIGIANNFYTFGGTFANQLKTEDTILISSGAADIFLLRCDTSGNIHWVKKASSPGVDIISNMLTDEKGITYLTGGFSDSFNVNGTLYASKGHIDIYIGAIDSTGNTVWMLKGGSEISGHKDDGFYTEKGNGIALHIKKQLHVVGTTIGSGNFGGLKYIAPESIRLNAFWLTLGTENSNSTINYQCDKTPIADTAFEIKVSPNPYTDNLTISNSLNINTNYAVNIYNSLGQQLSTKQFFNSSAITITDWNNLPSGLYFINIITPVLRKTFKLIKTNKGISKV